MGNMRRGHSTFNIRTRRLFCESKIEQSTWRQGYDMSIDIEGRDGLL
jgi:hypothetical protein